MHESKKSRILFTPGTLLLSLTIFLTLGENFIASARKQGGTPQVTVTNELGQEELIQRRREWFFASRRPGSDGKMFKKRMEAVEFTRRILREQASLFRAGAKDINAWIPRGPFSSNFGDWQFGKVSGRVSSIAKDFKNNILYLGSASGGLWKSTDDGQSWTSIFDTAGTQTIGAIALDPQDPQTIWVGTGESVVGSCEDYFGIGLLRSTDGGRSWEPKNGSSGLTLENLAAISSIIVDPNDSQRLIVGGTFRDCQNGQKEGGIYITGNAGERWSKRLSGQVTEIVQDPINTKVLWAGVANSGVYKSPDNGNTWSLQKASSLPTESVGRVEVTIAPSNSDYVYALFEHAPVGFFHPFEFEAQFWRTTDGGKSWTKMSSGNGACDDQCGYNMVLRVHRRAPDIVYRGTIRLYRSIDGGATWSDLIGPRDSLPPNWDRTQTVHQDIHYLLMDPDPMKAGTFYVGGDGGIWKTTDGGSTFTNLNANLSLTQFYDVGNHPTNNDIIVGGAQDNSSLARMSSDTWDMQLVTGDGFTCAINPDTPDTVYISSYAANVGDKNNRRYIPRVYRSIDGVFGPFGLITDTSNGLKSGDRINWVIPYTISPSMPTTLFLGTHRVYRSLDGGSNWTQVGPSDLAGGNNFLVTVHVSRSDGSYVYAGTNNSRIWRSIDGGDNWSEISTNLPAGRWINDIDTDPTEATHAFCVVSGFGTAHLYEYSSNGVWEPRGGGLPNVPANTLLVLSPNDIYVGTDVGIFKSSDGGHNFVPFMMGLPEGLVITDLEYTAATQTITAGTYGRGAWQINVPSGGGQTCDVPNLTEHEPNNDLSSATPITPTTAGTTSVGVICPEGDVDFFSFNATKDQLFSIRTIARDLNPPSDADTVLTLFNSNGNFLAENDDYGGSLDSLLIFAAPTTGRYYIRVRDATDSGGPTSIYQLVVSLLSSGTNSPELLPDDHPITPGSIGTADTLTTISLNLPMKGRTPLPGKSVRYSMNTVGPILSGLGTLRHVLDSVQARVVHAFHKVGEQPGVSHDNGCGGSARRRFLAKEGATWWMK
jgi:hypothetical protein